MVQRILLEIVLFLLPFGAFLLFRAISPNLRIADRWPVKRLVAIGFGLAVAALILTPLLQPSDKGLCYQAQRYENGVTIPAQRVDCALARPPARAPTPPAPPPVAPRNQTPDP
ncbi:MAG: hypothetical protein KGS00_06570 [Alphaproteobacteria bacterium]|nr:hypothetical protein [Alphaproteobacteria bacterium]